jgi:hypothetical protein
VLQATIALFFHCLSVNITTDRYAYEERGDFIEQNGGGFSSMKSLLYFAQKTVKIKP